MVHRTGGVTGMSANQQDEIGNCSLPRSARPVEANQ
jgi:hypothetical protein